ncbi:MAG: GerW family sporulation protein [Clostridia bacterium]|nr:GerW family sporulation protein [Clostridia bacterium]
MATNPIEGLMGEAMGKLKHMIDANTVIGEPITTADGATIIPVSKVAFGFGAGGSEFGAKPVNEKEEKAMFGGASFGGASVKPLSFLVIKDDCIRLIPVTESMSATEKIVDMIPELLNKFNKFLSERKARKSEISID